MKAIIILPLTNSKSTPPQGKFRRSDKHNAHIFEGKEYGLEEFNKVVDKALTLFPDRSNRPTVRLVSESVSEAVSESSLKPMKEDPDYQEAVTITREEEPFTPAPSHLREPILPSKKRHAKRKRGLQAAIA